MTAPQSPMEFRPGHESFVLLDAESDANAGFLERLRAHGAVRVTADLPEALALLDADPAAFGLFDTRLLADAPAEQVRELVQRRSRGRLALVTDSDLDAYIFHLRAWGITQSFVKTPPVDPEELLHFLCMVADPLSGFGLVRCLRSTIQVYSLAIDSIASKVSAIERVTNHFATQGFEVHELYDVRLILEEATNNAFYHAFQTAAGEERYSPRSFTRLAAGESVRIEYGSDAERVGFSVTDNSGRLRVDTIIGKLERQMNKDGVFDESGRGLYLSRLLTTRLLVNIQEGRRTQLVAIFDGTRRSERPKPFLLNYCGPDRFAEWGVDPDLEIALE